MTVTPEALQAFAEAAACGSFSAAARQLGKGQSTVSEAIAGLEIELGVVLFDRSRRQPVLTDAGRLLLAQARELLAQHDRLQRTAGALAAGLEPRLTIVVSDTYQSARYEATLAELDARHPELALECLVAEGADVIQLLQQGRAHLGLVASRPPYPPDLAAAGVPDATPFAPYIAAGHPLARRPQPTADDLREVRELRLATLADPPAAADTPTRRWSAPSYLMLLEMAELGFGWAALPCWLVDRFAAGRVVPLALPGWPRSVSVDLLWSSRRPLGAAAHWMLSRLTRVDPSAPT